MKPFVDQEHAWTPCALCGELTYPGIQHACNDAEPESDWVVLAIIASVAIALLLLVTGAWQPGWPSRG